MADTDTGTVTDLARRVEGKLWGKYRATVTSNQDPDKRGRLRLKVPTVFRDQETDWVPGAFALGGNGVEAAIAIPATGSQVLVEFIEGDRSAPIWTATYWDKKIGGDRVHEGFDLPQGDLHWLRTRGGIELRLEDNGQDKGQSLILRHPSGAEIAIDTQGVMTLRDAASDGAEVVLDPGAGLLRLKGHDGQEILMENNELTLKVGSASIKLSSSGITLAAPEVKLDGDSVTTGKGASSPILNAQTFGTFFDAHVHGPPGSPPAPPSSSLLSTLTLMRVKGA